MANEKEFDLFSWSALEYEEKERSVDWFWALGVIVVAGSVASILFKNYFFAMLLIIAGILLGFFAIKKPETVNYALTNKGFKMKTRLYPYEELKAFWIQIEVPKKDIKKPILFLKSKRIFLPILSIPIDEEIAPKIKEILSNKNIPEEEMHDHISDRIMENLGF
ncbi:MAG TPA: hypothetical protein PLO44_01425 [Candidatus Paceibacterota bacterium]|nr:hypothetical protein [Candidatus Paceibacterota bacterium]